ncbi:MAG: hypothetical protein ACYCOU_05305 [Sulfobacillus sp.]
MPRMDVEMYDCCEALTHDRQRCSRPGKHLRWNNGQLLHLCTQHVRGTHITTQQIQVNFLRLPF